MASLPVPAKTYLQDFDFDLLEYNIIRNRQTVAVLKGIINKDEDGNHVAFLIGFELLPGDVLEHGGKKYVVKSTGTDTHNGKPEIIKAYY